MSAKKKTKKTSKKTTREKIYDLNEVDEALTTIYHDYCDREIPSSVRDSLIIGFLMQISIKLTHLVAHFEVSKK